MKQGGRMLRVHNTINCFCFAKDPEGHFSGYHLEYVNVADVS